MILLPIFFLLVFLDRASKNFFLKKGSLLKNKFFQLQLKENYGLYSLIFSKNLLFFLNLLVLSFIIILFLKNLKKGALFSNFGFILIFLGGLSNLYDRLTFGYVIDWFWFFLFPFSVFNLADLMIFLGCILVFISLLKTGLNF